MKTVFAPIYEALGGAAAGFEDTAMYRPEDERLITGRGNYTDDQDVPDALWAAFVRSPYAHAEIAAIDGQPALAVAGARLVLTAADLADDGVKPIAIAPRLTDADGRYPRAALWPVLAEGIVRHAGVAIAMCVGETQSAAIDMAEAVRVDYRELPVVTDVAAALKTDAPQLWPQAEGNVAFRWGLGEHAAVAAAMARAAHVVEVEVVSQRVVVCPMEPRAAVARYDAASGIYRLDTGNQGMTILRDQVAAVLGVEKHRVHVRSGDVGGAFGIRNGTYPEYPALLVASRRLGRPVRWTATRSEGFQSDAQARDSRMRGRMALDEDGRILALDAQADANMGGYMQPMGYFIACSNFARCLPGPYSIPALTSTTTCVLTNTVPTAPYRGAGRPEAAYLTESLIEAAALKTGLDAAEIRRRNFIAPADIPHRTAVGTTYDSGDFPGIFEAALAASDWAGASGRKTAALERGKYRGIGIGIFVEISGGVNNERAQASLSEDGRVHVRTVLGDSGQGHRTVFALIAAEQLGLGPERVVVEIGDSTGFEDGGGSSASRSTTMGGLAIRAAVLKLLDLARERAAERLQATASELTYSTGEFTVPGTGVSINLEVLVNEDSGPLAAEARIEAEPTFPNGCHVAEVEIDPDTGQVTIARYVAVDDCGRVIEHELAEAQVYGSLAQGIGQALMEHGVYDAASGQLATGSYMDYAVPRSTDLPSFDSILRSSPARSNPLGVKGLGEGGTVGALPAIANAIRDALKPLGTIDVGMPATPHRVWQAIEAARKRALD